MTDGVCLILVKEENYYDITQLVEQIQWKGASCRTLSAKLIDDDGYQHARSHIDVEQGNQCLFYYDGVELFRGIIMTQTQNNSKKMTFTAYDNRIYLANNKDTFVYENKTASEIFRDCCTRFQIPMGEVAECTYSPNSSLWSLWSLWSRWQCGRSQSGFQAQKMEGFFLFPVEWTSVRNGLP